MALQHIGRVMENSEQFAGAEEVLRQALELRPDKTEAGQHWISLRQRQCKWPTFLPSEHASPKQMLDAISPISLAAYADDPMFQLARAHMYNKTFVGRPESGPIGPPAPRKKIGSGERLRVGYVSSDLREHAVGFALCEVFELHDKSKVEIFAYYCGDPRSGDATHERIRAAVDQWCDIGRLSDLQAAQKIANDAIDILVDLNGYTKHARTKIFAYRPAPVIVNWCGYPGTMGSPYHHYLIADRHVIPPENEIFYSERVLRIPCNQPIDRKREISAFRPSRAQVGLPDNAFVYASLNGMQKLTANCFARWMTILKEVPDSVLWLLTGDAETNQRLRDAAAQRGVSAERILFAQKAANPHHLARIPLADLFLDTTPYGAHSTAADALTMGLPILTLRGRSFASRFCSSVIAAAGLGDLICSTPEEYVQRAIAFGRDRQSLIRYRDQLRLGREVERPSRHPGAGASSRGVVLADAGRMRARRDAPTRFDQPQRLLRNRRRTGSGEHRTPGRAILSIAVSRAPSEMERLCGDPAGQKVLAGRPRGQRAAAGRCGVAVRFCSARPWRSRQTIGTREAHDG